MIIGDGIMLGAGGETASIFVTGLSETDSVSATHKIPVKVPNPEWKVPDGYTQLEYIESTGTQWINTRLTKSSFNYPIIETKFLMEETGDLDWFGTNVEENGNIIWNVDTNSNKLYLRYGRGTSPDAVAFVSNFNVAVFNFTDSPHTLKLGGNHTKTPIYVDGENVATLGTTLPDFSKLSNSTTLCINYARAGAYSPKKSKWYYYKVDDYDGSCIFNGIPAKRVSDNAIGMYDLVTTAFFENAGTGTFVAGPEIPQYIDGYVDGKTIAGKWTQKPNPEIVVPDGYTQLEYIESTGTQYINTEYTPTRNTIWETDFQFVGNQSSAGKDGGAIGSIEGCRFHFAYLTGGSWHIGVGDFGNFGTADNNRHLFVIRGSGVCSVDETNYTISNASVSGGKIWLFNWYHTGNSLTRPAVGKLYSTKISESEKLIHELIPVKRISDNAIGLYDKVEQKFYANAGTGTFTAGPEIPQIADGFLIDKIKSYGTWTVTATDGTNTATQDVLVDAADVFSVEVTL